MFSLSLTLIPTDTLLTYRLVIKKYGYVKYGVRPTDSKLSTSIPTRKRSLFERLTVKLA